MPIDPEKGFHIGTLFSCLFTLVAQGMNSFLILPSLPFLVKMYFPGIDISDISYYSGFLLSAFYLGQIPGCIFWGWFADRYGRKKSMIIMNILSFLCVFFFGLSKNYYFSLVIRLLHGLFDGTLGVNKTIVAELSNRRNISLGTSFVFASGAVSRIVGPLFSTYLTDMKVIAPLLPLMPFLHDMPFLLPFSIVSIFHLLSALLFIFFAEDTISYEELAKAKEYKQQMKREMSGILRKNSIQSCDSHEQLLLQYHKYSSYTSILKDKDIFLAVLIYFFLTLVQMSFDGLFPSVLANRRKFGGFEMDIADISFINMATAPISLCPMLLCPVLARFCKYRTQMIACSIGFALVLFLYPTQAIFNNTSTIFEFMVAIIYFHTFMLFRTIVFNVIIVVTSNVCYKEFRATVMGFAQTIGGLGRFIGPSIFPPIYAWSCHIDVFPIHHGFAFYILGLIAIICPITVYILSPACETGRGSVTETIVHKN